MRDVLPTHGRLADEVYFRWFQSDRGPDVVTMVTISATGWSHVRPISTRDVNI